MIQLQEERNLSAADICRTLKREGGKVGVATARNILKTRRLLQAPAPLALVLSLKHGVSFLSEA